MTQIASIPNVEHAEDDLKCRHHWVIQPADGPESQGICQSCGEIREFKNYVEGATWGDFRLASRSSQQASEDVSRVVADQIEGDGDE